MTDKSDTNHAMIRLPKAKTILIMTGGPGTGKTGLTERLLTYLKDVNVISYDAIKEKNWDIYGFDNDAQKYRLNEWGLEEFYLTIQKHMWANHTILIEYPFYQKHKPKLQELIEEYHYTAVTIFLNTDLRTVYERGFNRDHDNFRHPGHLLSCYHKETFTPDSLMKNHNDYLSYKEFCDSIAKKDYDIHLGLRIPVDVSDFSKVDFKSIVRQIVEFENTNIKQEKTQ